VTWRKPRSLIAATTQVRLGQEPGALIPLDLDAGHPSVEAHPNPVEALAKQDPFRLLDPLQGRHTDPLTERQACEQAGVGGLSPAREPQGLGDAAHIGLGDGAVQQRGQDAELAQGAQPGPVVLEVVQVGAVQDRLEPQGLGGCDEPLVEGAFAEVATLRRDCPPWTVGMGSSISSWRTPRPAAKATASEISWRAM
jgi:hypothetical protein